MPPNPAQVDKAIDRPQQMLLRHMPFERKPIEQRVLLDLPFPHHRLPPAVVIWQNQTDYITILQAFFNSIGGERSFAAMHRGDRPRRKSGRSI